MSIHVGQTICIILSKIGQHKSRSN